MMKVIKTGLTYIFAIALSCAIIMFVNFSGKFQLSPKNVYKVYLDGKEIGNVKDKNELEEYINEEQKELKEKYNVNKVYVPEGVDIQKCITYKKDVKTAKQINNIIKEKKPFTVEGYKVTIKTNSSEEEDIIINVLDKDMFDKAIKSVVEAFVSKEDVKNYENDTQPEIKETGTLIEDIYIDQNINIKHGYISTDEEIFTDEKTLTKYLLFGSLKEDQYYTVEEGDTIESIAYKNKLATEEFLIVNPEFTSSNNILSVGQQVKVGLINPIVDVVVETHNVIDQASQYKTVTQEDASMDYGKEVVVSEGQDGMDRLTTKIKTVNGETTNVVIVSSETLTPSVDKVVKVGTKIYAGGGTAPIMSGSWAWPTISQYYISSYFGYRWGKVHEAIDIAGSGEGSPIYAAGSGVVVTSQNKGSLGNHVTIDHGNGYYTLYAHLHSRNVTVGQTVQRGQQIGTMGHTGFATGTHLHFGLYRNGMPYRDGTPLDPLSLYR
ncbi:MAG: LysM peptidoglycan-binding domain-containing M23 family metallopeptidase [Candidatus Aphodocola sp.]